jgi:hypothetical protein
LLAERRRSVAIASTGAQVGAIAFLNLPVRDLRQSLVLRHVLSTFRACSVKLVLPSAVCSHEGMIRTRFSMSIDCPESNAMNTNRSVLILSVALVCSAVIAVMYMRDSQRERARADALAKRVLELEPVEKSNGSASAQVDARLQPARSMPVGHGAEPPDEQHSIADTPKEPKPLMEFKGTLRARKQVERLQLALVSGTPLQNYQIQALITAIDDVHRELEMQRANDTTLLQARTNERIIQVAADILFESQLEVFIELLQDKPQKKAGR